MNDQHQTPSQIAAANRAQAAEHGGHDHRTPSQIARDNQLTPHGHEPGHGHGMQMAEVKGDGPQGLTWLQWLQQRLGNNGGSGLPGDLARGRVLPDEQMPNDKGRDR
jgi:hypothetical protein